MYTAYCDGELIFDPRSTTLQLTSARLNLELNTTGAFGFTIHPSHPFYNSFHKLKSIITVYDDDELIFRGRVLNDSSQFYNIKQVSCEGELAFLLDSVVRPYAFTDTVANYFAMLINSHNAQVEPDKRFILGNVTVTDGDTTNGDNIIVRSDSGYNRTWDLIQKKLIEPLGGYLWVRHEADGNYIDYVQDLSLYNYTQTIQIGKNLMDVAKSNAGENIATAIIPIGGGEETSLTISSLPDGEISRLDWDGEEDIIYKSGDYVYSTLAVQKYGWVFKSVQWESVTTDVVYLRNVAVKELLSSIKILSSIELTAADLSGIENVNPFRLGSRIQVLSDGHGLFSMFLIESLSIDLLNPSNNILKVGKTFSTLTEETLGASNSVSNLTEQISVQRNFTTQVASESASLVDQSANRILAQVSQDYYLKSEAEQLVESVNTQFQQTNDEFEFRFNEFQTNIDDVQNGADVRFQEISKYIRFVDGNIVLGEDGNELTLKIQNDRISFNQSGLEVAYFSNRKLYVTDGEYTNGLRLGNFAFIPRPNGNLSFKKVT